MYTLPSSISWENLHKEQAVLSELAGSMREYLSHARWFGGKAYTLQSLQCDHILPLEHGDQRFYLFIVEAAYTDHESEYYLVPLAKISDTETALKPYAVASVDSHLVIDAVYDPKFQRAVFENVLAAETIQTNDGTLVFDRGSGLNTSQHYVSSHVAKVDQSNSSIFFNDKYFMKIYRKLFLETNPEVEMLKFLTEEGGYKHVPAYRGSLVWERKRTRPVTFALMMYKVDAGKDSWQSTGDELNDFLHAFLHGSFSIHEFVFEHVELLARRTAEMHAALARDTDNKLFRLEKFTPKYRTWLYEHLVNLLEGRIRMLENNKHLLDADAARMAEILKSKKEMIMRFFDRIRRTPLKSLRTRIHGDFHLGQVLYTNHDFIIIDFEGEPESTIADRKIRHSPLKDVAGMIRSFHYAVSAKLFFSGETKNADPQRLQKASERWFYLIRETFTETYLEALGKDQKLYASKSELNFLFLLHLLEKAIYELGYELNGRPDWIKIPLKGIEQVINELEKYEG